MMPLPPAPGPGQSPMTSPDLGVPSPPLPSAPAQPATPPPPVITESSKIRERQPAEKIKNPFERTATLLVSAAEDYAKRLSDNLSEQAADSMEADPQTVHEMMHFSRYGAAAPEMFWQVHDRILADATAAGDPDPYAAAERGALDEVYPYRSQIALLDVLGPDARVARAEQLMRMSDTHTARGNPPEALPHVTGPAGLPPPEQPPSNGRGY